MKYFLDGNEKHRDFLQIILCKFFDRETSLIQKSCFGNFSFLKKDF